MERSGKAAWCSVDEIEGPSRERKRPPERRLQPGLAAPRLSSYWLELLSYFLELFSYWLDLSRIGWKIPVIGWTLHQLLAGLVQLLAGLVQLLAWHYTSDLQAGTDADGQIEFSFSTPPAGARQTVAPAVPPPGFGARAGWRDYAFLSGRPAYDKAPAYR